MLRGPYERILTWPVVRVVIGVLFLVQGVSFAEAFTGNLEVILQFGARVSDFFRLQLYEMPDTLPLALPAALCLAVYLAVHTAREQGALVSLSAAGVAPRRIIGFALSVGAIGAAAIFVVIGELLPRAMFAERALFHEMRSYARVDALDSSAFGLVTQDIPGMTVIFGANDALAIAGEDEVVLFNHSGEGWRFAHAATAEAVRVEDSELPSLRLVDARAFGLPGDGNYALFDVEEIVVGFSSDEYLPELDNRLRSREVPQILCHFDPALTCPPDSLANLIRQGLLCLVAAMLALVGAANDKLLFVRGTGLIAALAATVAADVLTRAALGVSHVAGYAAGLGIIGGLILLVSLQTTRLLRPSTRS